MSQAAPPTLAALSRRLTSTSQLLLERSRVISLNLTPSASSTNTIVRNLTTIKSDLQRIEEELDANGLRGAAGSSGTGTPKGKGKGKGQGESEVEKQVREVGESYDRLVGMLSEDEGGRERAKALIREKPQAAKTADSPHSDPFSDPDSTSTSAQQNDTRTDTIVQPPNPPPPALSLEPPTPLNAHSDLANPFQRASNNNVRPFRDDPDEDEENLVGFGSDGRARVPGGSGIGEGEGEEASEGEMLSQQQVMMDDQDNRLNLLSNSITRQNALSLQIGSELDLHHDLLEDTDAAMDRTAARLGRARRRLDKVASEAKQYGSTITIVALILVLLILIIVFKT